MKLYFDIGNTSIKLNFEYKENSFYFSFKTSDNYSPDSLFSLLPNEVKNSNIESVWISSVVQKKLTIIELMIKKYFNIKPIIVNFLIKTGVKLKVTDPKSIGSDIIALSSFASSKSDNAIMINLGTATTITHIQDKTMMGIIIAPGIGISKNALIKSASKLYEMNLQLGKKEIGNNSEESLSIGILKGHVHMIRGFINNIDPSADLFISGGYSKLIKDWIEATYIKEATIEGIKIIEKLNDKTI